MALIKGITFKISKSKDQHVLAFLLPPVKYISCDLSDMANFVALKKNQMLIPLILVRHRRLC